MEKIIFGMVMSMLVVVFTILLCNILNIDFNNPNIRFICGWISCMVFIIESELNEN
jgi:hypothetical protein